MTPLRMTIQRIVPRQPRPLVVAIEPADPVHDLPAQIAMREQGRRTWFRLAVGAVYLEAVRRTVAARQVAKCPSRRGVRRSLL